MNKIMKYNREQLLATRLNNFLCNSLKLPQTDYYGNLTTEKIIGLKAFLSDINNIVTLRLSMRFSEWLKRELGINQEIFDTIQSQIKQTKPNTNGYDIEYTSDVLKLIAEVKCNVPINEKDRFGSAQKNGIRKDLNGLLHGKSKSNIDMIKYLKFLVLYDTDTMRLAMKSFHNRLPAEIKKRVILSTTSFDDPQNVYVIFLKA